MHGKALVVVMAASTLLVGCGGSSTPSGKSVFAQNCSACHSLTGIESAKRQGGDLRHADFSRAVMIQFAREMPVRKPLSRAELERVADYVVRVERAAR